MADDARASTHSRLPIDVFMSPFVSVAKIEAAGGILLMDSTIAARIWADPHGREKSKKQHKRNNRENSLPFAFEQCLLERWGVDGTHHVSQVHPMKAPGL